MLCPEPHRSKHAQYLMRYQMFGNPRVLGIPRNLYAQHRNGSTFPISLHVRKTNVSLPLVLLYLLLFVGGNRLFPDFSMVTVLEFTFWIT